jgi:hypothetical protein
VDRIRWDPTGQQLAFLVGAPEMRLFVVNADGTHLHQVRFKSSWGNERDLTIRAFAWSPDGRELILRVEAGKKCNYIGGLGYKFEVGEFPCIASRELYRSLADGSQLTKVSSHPDYDLGDLFWVQ